MKRTITLRYLFTLCVMTLVSAFCGGNLASAEEVTLTGADLGMTSYEYLTGKTYTASGVKFSVGGTGNAQYNSTIRIYSGNTFTIEMEDGKSKITKIEFTPYSSSSAATCFSAVNGGSYANHVWTAGAEALSSVDFTSNGSYKISKFVVTYEPASEATKKDVKLNMPDPASIDVLETFNAAATLTELDGGALVKGATISYSIEPATGDFTFNESTGLFKAGKTEGFYTIKASFAGDKNYNWAEESTTVTVRSRVWATKNYVKVTDESQLVDGAQYILVYDDGQNFNYMGDFNASQYIAANIGGNRYGDGIIPSGIEDTYKNPSVMPFTLVSVGNNFALHTKYGYLQCFNSGTTIMVGLNVADTYKDNNLAQWTIKIDAGNAHIVNVEDNTLSLAYDQYNSGYQAMRNPSSVQLYAKCAEMPFNAQALGYGTFAVPYAYKMPAGVKGYAIAGLNESDNTKLVKAEAYSAGKLVPALTPLLVYNENVADANVNAYPIIVNKEVTASYMDKNYLEYKRNAEDMTASQGAVKYYKLTKNASEDKPLGFYWGAGEGAAFRMANSSTAYLALPQSINAAAGLLFDEAGEATGIQLTPAGETAAPAVYNLQGVRVSGKLAKGLYIVNGKKVLVK